MKFAEALRLRIEVRPARDAMVSAATARDERRIGLLVRANLGASAAAPFYGYALHEAGAEPPP